MCDDGDDNTIDDMVIAGWMRGHPQPLWNRGEQPSAHFADTSCFGG